MTEQPAGDPDLAMCQTAGHEDIPAVAAGTLYVDDEEIRTAYCAECTAGNDDFEPDASYHPEAYCHRCGGPNRRWAAPSPLWNVVMRADGLHKWDEIVCPTCFMVLADGIACGWRLVATEVLVELPTTFDGRVWDPERWLWVDP